MRIAALLAVSTLLAISAAPGGAYAMFNPGPSNNSVVCRGANCGGGGGGGGDTSCAAICGTPQIAKTNPQLDCTDDLVHLPRITKGDIAMISSQRLHIAPVCQGYADLSLTEKQHRNFNRGNTPGLETAIAGNPAIMAELTSHHYKVDDVLGILIGSNAAVLYVHKM